MSPMTTLSAARAANGASETILAKTGARRLTKLISVPSLVRHSRSLRITTRAPSYLISEFASGLRGRTNEISGVVRVAFALVPGLARIGTKRTLHGDPLGGIVVDKFCRDDLGRRRSILHPMDQRGEGVMAGVGGRRAQAEKTRRVEPVGAGAAEAVSEAGRQEEACEPLSGLIAPELVGDALVEANSLERRHDRIRPALIDDHLSAAVTEFAQAAQRCAVDGRPKHGVDLRHVPLEIEVTPIPIRAQHPLEEAIKPWLARRVGWRFEKAPIEQARFASGKPSVEKRLARLIGWPGIKRLGGLVFVGREARVARRTLACERRGVEVAGGGVGYER